MAPPSSPAGPIGSRPSSPLRVVPLGGLGQIGMNCLALEHDGATLVIDCGSSFPQDDAGVDVLHPDFRWLTDRSRRVVGVVLTHGHEDHIGGLPYLLAGLDVPVWGPPHALALVARRLEEHALRNDEVSLRPVTAGEILELGPFRVEPVRVSHSIVEATALRIETPAGTVVHSGDFTFDPDPPDGEPTDVARLEAIGDAGVDLLLSDSTNVDLSERPGSEREVALALDRLIAQAPRRVVVTLFASNVQRLISLGEIARRHGRRVCLLGRSLLTQVEVATRLGRLDWPSDLLVAPEQLPELLPERVLVLAGGTQAEPASSLRRVASAEHGQLAIEPGDLVVLSSRAIPGKERVVHDMVCDLLRRGARVVTRATDPGVHVSGHASRAEQGRMIELLRPRAFVPIHGTLHHLREHAALARQAGVGEVLVIENGVTAQLEDGRLRTGDPIPHGEIAVAMGGEELDSETYTRRLELGRAGVVLVSMRLGRDGHLVGPPVVTARGVPCLDDDANALRKVALDVARARLRGRHGDEAAIVDTLRRAARRSVLDLSGTRPAIEVHLVPLD
ncbi:MAG: ribonuclease J [Polyangiaceae bacterium]|nr:ribonuclease J [Polyangiaceae bacterium]